jgi:hypothetical protein
MYLSCSPTANSKQVHKKPAVAEITPHLRAKSKVCLEVIKGLVNPSKLKKGIGKKYYST